jgi:hypothetical protein
MNKRPLKILLIVFIGLSLILLEKLEANDYYSENDNYSLSNSQPSQNSVIFNSSSFNLPIFNSPATTQGSSTPAGYFPSGTFVAQTFSDSSFNSTPISMYNTSSNMNLNNPNMVISTSLLPNQNLNNSSIMGSTYENPALPGSNNILPTMNFSSLPNPQNSSLNNYADALSNTINSYNVAITPASTIPYPTLEVGQNNLVPINHSPVYQQETNEMQRARVMYDNVSKDINNSSFVQEAQRYGLTVEKSGGYGLNPRTGLPGAYAQVDIMPYDPVINSVTDALNKENKAVAITSDGVLTVNPIKLGQSRSIVIDHNNPTFIGSNNVYSMYRSTPELAQDIATHNAEVAQRNNIPSYNIPINESPAQLSAGIQNSYPVVLDRPVNAVPQNVADIHFRDDFKQYARNNPSVDSEQLFQQLYFPQENPRLEAFNKSNTKPVLADSSVNYDINPNRYVPRGPVSDDQFLIKGVENVGSFGNERVENLGIYSPETTFVQQGNVHEQQILRENYTWDRPK